MEFLVVEFISAKNVPKADIGSESDPFLKVWIEDKNGKRRYEKTKTEARQDAKDPVWHSFKELGLVASDDVLVVHLFDEDLIKHDKLGVLSIPISSLSLSPSSFTIPTKSDNICSLSLRRVPYLSSLRKRIFLIRHGESKWNHAQDNKNVKGMLAFDHGLNEEGVEQGLGLNKKWREIVENKEDITENVRRFLEADIVYASPLTRATETALLTLANHPTVNKKGITLLRKVREIKNVGGLDTVGKEVGIAITTRVHSELASVLGDDKASQYMVPIDVFDCETEWWTSVKDMDTKAEIKSRLEDFLLTLRYTEGETIIAVGHSLLFRRLVQTYLDPEFVKANPELGDKLMTKKLANAGCMALDLHFSDETPIIKHIEMMFGSGFHE